MRYCYAVFAVVRWWYVVVGDVFLTFSYHIWRKILPNSDEHGARASVWPRKTALAPPREDRRRQRGGGGNICHRIRPVYSARPYPCRACLSLCVCVLSFRLFWTSVYGTRYGICARISQVLAAQQGRKFTPRVTSIFMHADFVRSTVDCLGISYHSCTRRCDVSFFFLLTT